MRFSDWSSDVCSSDLGAESYQGRDQSRLGEQQPAAPPAEGAGQDGQRQPVDQRRPKEFEAVGHADHGEQADRGQVDAALGQADREGGGRSEEHTSELQSLMRISYAVFCLKKKNTKA